MKRRMFQQTRLHLDATRSSALFADRLLLVEGVTEACLLRTLGRRWAGGEDARIGFIDGLAILPIGNRIGMWPIRMLAAPGHELVTRVAALSDTDYREAPSSQHEPPSWHEQLDPRSARFFWSHPTFEPSLVAGNEELIKDALEAANLAVPEVIDPLTVDRLFIDSSAAKGRFALALAEVMDLSLSTVTVPNHISEMFDWLYEGITYDSRADDHENP